ncbi:LpqB family beta-propeller domain-containing protein [Nocardioides sp.]|uniref:LpqB family beta-propeller domain-containing protein n=1 Tax=Nocardioides sp. TaxID=35761 RepID=UPI00351235DB
MTPRPRQRVAVLTCVAWVVGPVLALTSCTSLPEQGPVRSTGAEARAAEGRASDITPAPPVPGATRAEIVDGFLRAMTASPIREEVAAQFLTDQAASGWAPDRATITYEGRGNPIDRGGLVTVALDGADRLDRDRAYQGPLGADAAELVWRLRLVAGEWRIDNPPDALIVPLTWFVQRFRRADLYFYDPSGRILVPQPVYVPRGEQLASSLVTGLVGIGARLAPGRVMRTALPPGTAAGLGVPVTADGVAQVTLTGAAPEPAAAADIYAQVAWTLRQDPRVTAVQLTVDGVLVPTPDGGATYPVEDAASVDPAGSGADPSLFALRGGVLTRREGNELVPVAGPFGTRARELAAVAVDLPGQRAAAVGDGGRSLVVGPLGPPAPAGLAGAGTTAPAPPQRPLRRPLTGATDLLRPGWDVLGRLWTIDRTPAGAVVRYLDLGPGGADADGPVPGETDAGGTGTGDAGSVTVHTVRAPGISGRRVSSFLVSRDGTRLVAVVQGRRADQVLVGRIEVDAGGVVRRLVDVRPLLGRALPDLRVRAVAWTSPTTLAVASVLPGGAVAAGAGAVEVRSVPVDGAPAATTTLATVLADGVRGLAATPTPDLPAYLVTATGLVDLATDARYGFVGDAPSAVTYVG